MFIIRPRVLESIVGAAGLIVGLLCFNTVGGGGSHPLTGGCNPSEDLPFSFDGTFIDVDLTLVQDFSGQDGIDKKCPNESTCRWKINVAWSNASAMGIKICLSPCGSCPYTSEGCFTIASANGNKDVTLDGIPCTQGCNFQLVIKDSAGNTLESSGCPGIKFHCGSCG